MILVVDDDPSVTASLAMLLKQHRFATKTAGDPEEAFKRLSEGPCELVLQDMNFSRDTSGQEGLELLRQVRSRYPQVPVILITAWGSISLAVEGIKAGASDFVTKPWTNSHLIQSIRTVLSLAGGGGTPDNQPAPQRGELDRRFDFNALIGEDPEFLKMLAMVGRVAPTEASVLISGESGTGKELVAEAIHRNSRRRTEPFIKVNLGGISSTLFESEMFGHVRGAFTDARSDRPGRFEVADGGTIFLDEIGELDPASQVKLLRVLQDRTFEVLGSSTTRTVDVRVVSATNRDLAGEVAAGRFREDLLYRLNLISLRLPALRDRTGDVELLARRLLARCCEAYSRASIDLTGDAARWLRQQPWPGNVRQLKQSIERAVLVADSERLTAADLEAQSELDVRRDDPDALPRPGSMTLDQLERAMIVKCMQHYEGNVTHVAEALGLSRAALYRRLEKYGILDE